jgi:hypothetical protein
MESYELLNDFTRALAELEEALKLPAEHDVMKAAFSIGWINEEEVWLGMLASRNKMAHTYSV